MPSHDNPVILGLSDIEDAIGSHPKEVSELYWECRDAFKAGQSKAKANEWAREHSLTTEDVKWLHEYLFAAAFVAAWHAVHGDKSSQRKAANSYCAVAAMTYDLPPEAVFTQFLQLEELWKKTFAKKGIGNTTSWASCLILTILIGGGLLFMLWAQK